MSSLLLQTTHLKTAGLEFSSIELFFPLKKCKKKIMKLQKVKVQTRL